MSRKLADFLNVLNGFRKFILMMCLFLVGCVFRVKGFISGSEFIDLLKSTTISFFAANSGEHILNTVKVFLDAKGKPTSPVPQDDNVAVADDDEPSQPEVKK